MSFWAAPLGLPSVFFCRVPTTAKTFWLLSIAAGGAGLPRGTAAAPLALIFNGVGFGFFSDAVKWCRLVANATLA